MTEANKPSVDKMGKYLTLTKKERRKAEKALAEFREIYEEVHLQLEEFLKEVEQKFSFGGNVIEQGKIEEVLSSHPEVAQAFSTLQRLDMEVSIHAFTVADKEHGKDKKEKERKESELKEQNQGNLDLLPDKPSSIQRGTDILAKLTWLLTSIQLIKLGAKRFELSQPDFVPEKIGKLTHSIGNLPELLAKLETHGAEELLSLASQHIGPDHMPHVIQSLQTLIQSTAESLNRQNHDVPVFTVLLVTAVLLTGLKMTLNLPKIKHRVDDATGANWRLDRYLDGKVNVETWDGNTVVARWPEKFYRLSKEKKYAVVLRQELVRRAKVLLDKQKQLDDEIDELEKQWRQTRELIDAIKYKEERESEKHDLEYRKKHLDEELKQKRAELEEVRKAKSHLRQIIKHLTGYGLLAFKPEEAEILDWL